MVIAHASFRGNWRRVNLMAMSPVSPKVFFLHPEPPPAKEYLGLTSALQVDAGHEDGLPGRRAACNLHRDGVLQQLCDDPASAVHEARLAGEVPDANHWQS